MRKLTIILVILSIYTTTAYAQKINSPKFDISPNGWLKDKSRDTDLGLDLHTFKSLNKFDFLDFKIYALTKKSKKGDANTSKGYLPALMIPILTRFKEHPFTLDIAVMVPKKL